MITTAIIVAVAENGIIGDNNKLPWNIKSEMKHFTSVTINKPVIMGRKTFESIGKPLKDRRNIIITSDTDYKVEGAYVVNSLTDAIELGKKLAKEDEQDEVIIAGGANIYEQAIKIVDRLYVTRVHLNPKGDTKFPEFNKREWHEVKSEFHRALETETADYTIRIFDRIS